jgi:hypothetical protein
MKKCPHCGELLLSTRDKLFELTGKIPKREWVGLTDEEKEAATGWSVEHIEAKLKEKNNGNTN